MKLCTLLVLASSFVVAGRAASQTSDSTATRHPVHADSLFERALELAPSNKARADYLYFRQAKGFGGGGCARALEYDPLHAPCLYQQLAELGDAVGRQTTLEGRFAYWCLADRHRQLAALIDDARIQRAALHAAARYDRAGPHRDVLLDAGYQPGQMVSVDLPDGETCRTPVR